MAYQMAATAVTLNNFEGHSQVVGLFKCNSSNICASFYTISTDSVLAVLLRSRGGQKMAKVHSHKEILPKASTPRAGCTNVTGDRRKTDERQTDGFAIAK